MSQEYEYIVVGSGPGGGTLAARLAENGKKVLLLEAGGDPMILKGSDATTDQNRLPQDYEVPVFHAFSTENRAMKWDYFVRHYGDTEFQKQDPKYSAEYEGEKVDGVLYPRAGCLGGCSAHNAMITVYPHNDDWNHIADLTGDSSWRADHMRTYYEKLENCQYRAFWWRWLAKLGFNKTRHGFSGWLTTEKAIPWRAALKDWKLIETLLDSIEAAFKKLGHPIDRLEWLKEGAGDPNDWRLVKQNAIGLRYPPLATRKHKRNGSRERVLDVAKRFPQNLTIEMNALVTHVILDDDKRAVGVEYLKGERLYKANCLPRNTSNEKVQVYCTKEVILSGGAFNTPQLLMLSGIGPKDELEKHGIEVKVDLPGVGRNMQDRYEVGVVNRMNFDNWEVLEGAKYEESDPQYQQWQQQKGVYTTNGAILAVIKRSFSQRPLPDLFCFALLAKFRGYFPGYSELIKELNYMTWAILKAHTNNTAGYVALRSADPTDTPYINFQYFQEGNDISGDDLQSVIEGIKFVREMTQPLKEDGLIAEEELPGEQIQTDEEIADFVRKHAWGHHASCTCPIGRPEDEMSVLDSHFKVKGVEGLRVVDASVFPKIPGFFIVSAIYMIGEKAADVILQQDA